MRGLASLIMKRVRVSGRGRRVFAAKDFLDLGARAAVDQALTRLTKAGELRRVSRGLYDWPRHSPVLDAPAPADTDAVIAAVARRTGQPIVRDALAAANAMGLTTAVPTRMAFVTTGKASDFTIGGRRVKLSMAPASVRPWIGSRAAPIVQALVWARDARLSLDDVATTIARHTSDDAARDLAKGLARLPGWALAPAQSIVANRINMAG
jgi:predicted transcriptional regulator of viral defense system